MKDNLSTIVEGRVCDGILFAEHRDRLFYIRTLVRKRPQWLKENEGRWRYIKDIQREAASLAAPVESELNVVAASSEPNGQMSSHDVRKDGNAVHARVEAGCCRHRPRISAPVAAATATARRSHQPSPSRTIKSATPRRRRRPRVALLPARRASSPRGPRLARAEKIDGPLGMSTTPCPPFSGATAFSHPQNSRNGTLPIPRPRSVCSRAHA